MHTLGISPPDANTLKPLVVQIPAPFHYKDTKAVPWRYDAKVKSDYLNAQQKKGVDTARTNITNITGVGGMTRSGRVYTPEELRVKDFTRHHEEKENTIINEGVSGVRRRDDKKVVDERKKEVSDEEASEFLKFIRQSEYKLIDQLNHTPARVSLLSVLMNSESHRKLLMKILNEAHVSNDITLDTFGGIVGNITANNHLTFTDDEVPAEGRGHNKALHISVKCANHILARVLIDNGSSLNVMPKSTLDRLPCDGTHMKPSSMIVRAFDGSRREVMGEIEIPVQIGPFTFNITFQVMDIKPAYSCLLGRPWIHSAGVVPSSLHQKLKFIVEDKLVIVSGEEDMLVSCPTPTRYIEATEEALETSFQSLEIISTAYVESPMGSPQSSSASMMVAKVMMNGGYQPGLGLGKCLEGVTKLIDLPENKNRWGLGYKPTQADKRRMAEENKEKRLARLENREPKVQKIPICHLYQSFRSGGVVHADQVAMIKEDDDDNHANFIYLCDPCEELRNWKIVEFPVTLNSISK
uniref:G-patch domain-containing protein n=1 Tax=Cajanus cajan TaxID=3821 RepID=A0A151R2D5_CAJCA|nr:hypothetical protein KK1_042162 [Cajanus cajan]